MSLIDVPVTAGGAAGRATGWAVAVFNGGMCGRFILLTYGDELVDALAEVPGLPAPARDLSGLEQPSWNISPTQTVAAVTVADMAVATVAADAAISETLIQGFRWGLVPAWAKSLPQVPTFNARGETVATKPTFRAAFRRRRCLVPLDGWYEWRPGGRSGTATGKVPYLVTSAQGPMFAAGLWDRWLDPQSGVELLSCTIVTTASSGSVAWLHDRMPRILAPAQAEAWLFGGPGEAAALASAPDAAVADGLAWQEVSKRVGEARINDPALVAPVPEATADQLPLWP